MKRFASPFLFSPFSFFFPWIAKNAGIVAQQGLDGEVILLTANLSIFAPLRETDSALTERLYRK